MNQSRDGRDQDATNVMTQFGQRAHAVLRAEGFPGLIARLMARLKRRPAHHRSYIITRVLDDFIPVPETAIGVDIVPLVAGDHADAEALAAIDEWKASAADLLGRLAEGWQCCTAKYQDQIVASLWCREDKFYDGYLARHFELADHEIYYLAGFTIPAFRGQGIMLHLMAHLARAVKARDPRKTRGLGFIQVTNRPSLRTVAKGKMYPVGLVGYLEIFGVRFHYLWGRGVLPKTRKRFFVERV